MSREIKYGLIKLVKFRPEWHGDADETGAIKVIMTSTAERTKLHLGPSASEGSPGGTHQPIQKPDNPCRIVIVRDICG